MCVINYCVENLFILSMYDVNSILSLIIQKQISFIVKFSKLECQKCPKDGYFNQFYII